MIRARFEEEGPLKRSDELRRENEALRERISTLSAAILRISATLDLDTVLREVVESARTLSDTAGLADISPKRCLRCCLRPI